MIQCPGAIWMAPEPADMRKGIDGLSHQVRASFGHNPCAGDAFLFRNRVGKSDQDFSVGWHGGLAVPAKAPPRPLHMGQQG